MSVRRGLVYLEQLADEVLDRAGDFDGFDR